MVGSTIPTDLWTVQQLIVEQLSEEIENSMTSDKILSSILGDRLGYVRKKGYDKNPPKRSQTQQANIEANMSSAIESMRQEMQLDMERKLQEKREQIATVLKRDMDQDFQKKLEEEREHIKGEVEKYFKKTWLLAWLECNSKLLFNIFTGTNGRIHACKRTLGKCPKGFRTTSDAMCADIHQILP
ncbi:hypothetical protein P3L10_018799 [Capsicum annuum]